MWRRVVGNMYLQAAMVDSGFGVALMDEQSVTTIQGTMRLKTVSRIIFFRLECTAFSKLPRRSPLRRPGRSWIFFSATETSNPIRPKRIDLR